MMAAESENSLLIRTDAAALALLSMIRKLETDGHIRTTQAPAVSAVLLPELIALSAALKEKSGQDGKACMEKLKPLLFPAEEESISRGITERMGDFLTGDALLPAAFTVLCDFDAMAQEEDGAFYNRMGTENPGMLSGYYLALFEAMWVLSGGKLTDTVFEETEEKLRSAQPGKTA